jgi:DNA-binding transcriptional MerR regulator
MRTSELAERAGVNTQTLRYYERRGLLARPPRSASGYRDYPSSAAALVRFVKRVQELGFSLDEAAQLVQLAAGGPRACASARALATARIGEIERRLADLQRMRESLAELVATCELPRRDRQCSLLQALQSDAVVDGVAG